MIKVKGFSIENKVYSDFLEWLNRNRLNEDLLSRREFKSLLNEFKQKRRLKNDNK